jgi:hypothetical protein
VDSGDLDAGAIQKKKGTRRVRYLGRLVHARVGSDKEVGARVAQSVRDGRKRIAGERANTAAVAAAAGWRRWRRHRDSVPRRFVEVRDGRGRGKGGGGGKGRDRGGGGGGGRGGGFRGARCRVAVPILMKRVIAVNGGLGLAGGNRRQRLHFEALAARPAAAERQRGKRKRPLECDKRVVGEDGELALAKLARRCLAPIASVCDY